MEDEPRGRSAAVELSAKTVDDAVARALQQLGCTRDEVDVEVLHPGSPGRLLGFGAEPARVRVTPLVADSGPDPGPDRGDAGLVTVGAMAGTTPVPELDETEGVEGVAAAVGEGEDGTPGGAAEAPAAPRDVARDAELARIMLLELVQRMGMPELSVEVV